MVELSVKNMDVVNLILNGKTYKCSLKKSWRSSIAISLSKNKGIVVKAPKFMPDSLISKYLNAKKDWIIKNWTKVVSTIENAKKQYVNNEEHLYLGNLYKLKIKLSSMEAVKIIGDYIVIHISRESPLLIKNSLNSWYHQMGVTLLYERFNMALPIFHKKNIVPSSLRYKKLKGKWGACTHDNHILLNPDLIKTPLACIDYVVYHELCHVKHHNHSKFFYNLLEEMMPDWKIIKKQLRSYEAKI